MVLSSLHTFAGGSPCALGVRGACNVVYYSEYNYLIVTAFTVGFVAIIIALLAVKRSQQKSNALLLIGIIWAVAFSGFLIYAHFTSETELERTQKRAKICADKEIVYGGISCEY